MIMNKIFQGADGTSFYLVGRVVIGEKTQAEASEYMTEIVKKEIKNGDIFAAKLAGQILEAINTSYRQLQPVISIDIVIE